MKRSDQKQDSPKTPEHQNPDWHINLDYQVKAGALQFTIFAVVVIALLLGAFILLTHTHKTFKHHTHLTLETIANATKGVNYALNNPLALNDTILIKLQGKDYKTLRVHRNYWGLFEKVVSIATIKNKTFKKVALIGALQPKTERTALYLEDKNRPLVLVGHTKIQGTAHLPKQGVRTGNISGHSYYGDQLIYGQTKTSKKLPKLRAENIKQIKAVANSYKNLNSEQFLDLDSRRTYQNSFYKPVQIIYSPKTINLSMVSLTGHIMVQSDTKIIVEASSRLKDIILIAPIIELKPYTKGVFQTFASKEITVGPHCQLGYPSALILEETTATIKSNANTKETPFIKLHKNSEIKGIVAYLGVSKSYKPQVFIDKSTTITGEVYCNKNTELLGNVHGSVFVSGFVASQSGSVYQNHIYNGTIDIDELPTEYEGLSFKNSKKGIAKWLY